MACPNIDTYASILEHGKGPVVPTPVLDANEWDDRHRLLGTQRPQMLCVAAWVWFCLSREFVEIGFIRRMIYIAAHRFSVISSQMVLSSVA